MSSSTDHRPTARRRAWALARRLAAGACVAGAAALFASTVALQEGCADKRAPAAAPDPIVIGVSLGLTGNFESFSPPLRNAILVAQGEINAAGGLLGRPVRFDVVDDKSSEKEDIDGVARGFVQKQVAAVIGPLGSSQVVRTQGILGEAQILQISPTATSTELSTIQPEGDRFLFRTTPADDFQGLAVVQLAQKTPAGLGDAGAPPADGGAPAGCSRLGIVNIDNSYGNPMADLIEQVWPKRAGRRIAIRKKIPKELAADYKAVASEVYSATPQCLAIIAYDDVAAQFLRDFRADARWAQLEQSGFFFVGTDGIYTSGLLTNGAENPADLTSTNVAEGVYGTNPDTQSGSKEYNEFRTLYSSYFPLGAKDAPSFAANTFDAAILAALAIQKAGSATDRVAIRDALRDIASAPGKPYTPSQIGEALQAIREGEDIDYKGASGNLDFDQAGNVTAGFIVWLAARGADKKLDFQTVGRFSVEELLEQVQ